MDQDNGKPEEVKKGTRLRSPAYPGINLETALKRAKDIYLNERRSAANVKVILQHWGFKPTSGGGFVVVAALKSFGLIDEEGSGDSRSIRLSESCLRILLDERPESIERIAEVKKAALSPKIHSQLWSLYKGDLPSDSNLRHKLIFGFKFNENSVDEFIKEFKDTIDFAKLTCSDSLTGNGEDKDDQGFSPATDESLGAVDKPLSIGDFVQWESQGVLQFGSPRKVRGFSDDRLWAFIEGSDTGMPVDELTIQAKPVDPLESSSSKLQPRGAPSVNIEQPRPRTMAEAQRQFATPKSGTREDVFSLTEGIVTIQWPDRLSAESFEDLAAWLDILKRKIGRSISDSKGIQKERIMRAVLKLNPGAIVKFEDHGRCIWFRVLSPDESTVLVPFSEDREAEFYQHLSDQEIEDRLIALSNGRL